MKYGTLNLGQIEAVVNKLGGMEGVQRFLAGETQIVVGEVKAKPTSGILNLISSGQPITIAPCDGTATLAQAADLFTDYLDDDFVSYGTDVPSAATPETAVEVYELVKDARLDQMFPSVSADLDRLCLTQHQIKEFVLDHQTWLHPEGWATFFLFKVGDKFFVAGVYRHADGLEAHVSRFSHDYVWRAECRFRVVLPQLALMP